MPVNFRDAVRQDSQILLGIAGPSGSGKTYSSLLVADGIRSITGGEVFGIDTENGRMLHYADDFKFKYADMREPFSPGRYLEFIQAAQAAGAKVIIVDSGSHMHEGPGGVLDMHEAELKRMAGDDYKKRENAKFAAWIKPKAEFNRFLNALLQIGAHVIFCFRAKDKLVLVKNERGKLEPVSAGWTPIITERMDYEMTANVILPAGAQGSPDLSIPATKLPKHLGGIFEHGKPLTRETGRRLAQWAAGRHVGASEYRGPADERDVIAGHLRALESIAEDAGTESLKTAWEALDRTAQRALKDERPRLKAKAAETDARLANGDDDDLGFDDPLPAAANGHAEEARADA